MVEKVPCINKSPLWGNVIKLPHTGSSYWSSIEMVNVYYKK